MKENVILVNIISRVISAMIVPGITSINYQPGRDLQILAELDNADSSVIFKDTKFPLIAMELPITEHRDGLYYATVRIPRIVFATLVQGEFMTVLSRYDTGGTFQTILYPLYHEFLRCLALSPNVIGSDPDNFLHDKRDSPGEQPLGEGLNDYVDILEILNLELILSQIKTC